MILFQQQELQNIFIIEYSHLSSAQSYYVFSPAPSTTERRIGRTTEMNGAQLLSA